MISFKVTIRVEGGQDLEKTFKLDFWGQGIDRQGLDDAVTKSLETQCRMVESQQLGMYRQNFIFFVTYECSEEARVFCHWEAFLA